MNTNNGFWIGHEMLGDIMGFCAAAHLLADKLGEKVKVNFQESRKDAVNYFSGVEWVPKKSIPNAIDCGIDPSIAEWSNSNGVKRFYRFMDPTMTPSKSFDIHMNCEKNKESEKIIGLISHANTQGDIPENVLKQMIGEAKEKYPNHIIMLFGNKDNPLVEEVVDFRQENGDINWIIAFMKRLDLLITPQSGPCFIAAGLKIPMWVYRSKAKFWDYVLNYDNYKVEKWYERENLTPTEIFDKLYKSGGWNGIGSGPGSNVEINKEYLTILHKIIDYTPSIKTVIDIGCGDWQLMKNLSFTKNYIGIDVSPYIIEQNKIKYEKENVKFLIGDLISGNLPDGDICIVKDVLQHLTNDQVKICLDNLKKYKICIITNDYTDSSATDIQMGQWRPINILLPPFSVAGVTIYGYIGKQVILLGKLIT